jgi:hypothetical protein
MRSSTKELDRLESLSVVVSRHGSIVPLDLPFHESHARAKRRSGQNYMRTTRGAIAFPDRPEQGALIVAVDLVCVPTERSPSMAHGLEVEDIISMPEGLLSINVDNSNEPVQMVVGREHSGLPNRTLVALCIAE